MIERLLTAEAALRNGELEVAGRLFAQVAEADARNAIAVVGLARIAEREGRTADARALVERALAIDPDEAAALRLLRELTVPSVPASPDGPPPAQQQPLPAPAAPASSRPARRKRSVIRRIRSWLAGLLGRRS